MKRFRFALGPVERWGLVSLSLAVLLVPLAISLIFVFLSPAQREVFWLTLADQPQLSAMLLGVTIGGFVSAYATATYVRMRDRAEFDMNPTFVRFTKPGWMFIGVRVQNVWFEMKDLTRIVIDAGRPFGRRRTYLIIESGQRRLLICLDDAFEDGPGPRPVARRRHGREWLDHPLVTYLREHTTCPILVA